MMGPVYVVPVETGTSQPNPRPAGASHSWRRTYGESGVREVCRGDDIAWELDFTAIGPEQSETGYFVERNRFMVVDGGPLWYLLRVATWPDRFERYEEETDTFLYTFRFNRTPLSP